MDWFINLFKKGDKLYFNRIGGVGGFLVSFFVFFNSSTFIGFVLGVLIVTLLACWVGFGIDDEIKQGLEDSYLPIYFLKLLFIGILLPILIVFIFSSFTLTFPASTNARNIFTGECKWFPTRTLPWFYRSDNVCGCEFFKEKGLQRYKEINCEEAYERAETVINFNF